ncbi:hypothetical protein B0H63DRAFT_478534 [Podospora didyma]|uniref:SH3 domain-containing protein n=1 Tax=Podospora didyma TaxID=330526 RepID=A0AAE0KJN4_9PEZI|nr:hypothetical protein B0H63DRAFT_478534 [Podospora didyma]
MVLVAPPLPTRFPCWVRAVYSWGGESKRDLGFIEGDLIECLNAGDGQWWAGRLFRDRRAIGVFPSNFVEVLPDTFRPTTRSVSPLPGGNTPSPKNTPQKSKTFRKPFEAYSKAPHYTTAKIPETYKEQPARPRETSATSITSATVPPARDPSPPQPLHHTRAPSPAPSFAPTYRAAPTQDMRAPSPAPSFAPTYRRAPSQDMRSQDMRAPSPAPSFAPSYRPPPPHEHSRAPSPTLSYRPYRPPQPEPTHHQQSLERADSPPPPPPPPHRSAVSRFGSNEFNNGSVERQDSSAPYDHRFADKRPRHNSNASYDHLTRQASNLSYDHRPADTPRHNSTASYGHPPGEIPRHNSNASYEHRPLDMSRHNTHNSFDPRPLDMSRHNSTASFDNRPLDNVSRHYPQSSYDRKAAENLARHNSIASYHQQFVDGRPRHDSNVSNTQQDPGYFSARTPSPCPPSPGGGEGLTPSPLREAMDDVMEQLDALGVHRDTESPKPPLDPWSPESFDMVHHQSRAKRDHFRPQTSMGIAQQVDEGYETHSGSGNSSQDMTYKNHYQDGAPLPELSNYVERMESRLRSMHQHNATVIETEQAPMPPPKGLVYDRPKSSAGERPKPENKLRHKKSAYEVAGRVLNRTFTTKTNSTNATDATQSTNRSLMSGVSAGGISATSAGSLARKNRGRAQSALGMRDDSDRPETPFTGVTYHSSHASGESRAKSTMGFHDDAMAGLGGLVQPDAKPKKQNFIKRILESAKTGVASTRGNIAAAGAASARPSSAHRMMTGTGNMSSVDLASTKSGRDAARDMGLGKGVDWVQVRRDVNRSNSLSRNERVERRERCQMLDYPTLDPVDELYSSIDGDENADGMPVQEPINYLVLNLGQVDKNSRFVANLAPGTSAHVLATNYVCRPYRSDVQRLRAIFTWVAEKICWEEDYEGEDQIDTRRVIQVKRGSAEEYAVLVLEMCEAVGLPCEIVRGYLKAPGEIPDSNMVPRSNHWWNAVLVDNEWRMMDCCLASPSNPRRGLYSSFSSGTADPWWFLARPTEICWTHIPEHHAQQHICPPVAHEVLFNLPCTCPPYFKNGLEIVDYNTSLTRIEDLEMVHIKFNVPPDVEVAAEVEVRAYSRDADGDFFESGEVVRKRALAQAEWFGGVKRYTVKALLPGDEGTGTLKIYAGKRGLMHSIKDIPHPLAFALPIIHTGENPPYEFVTRHPTPHAQRHDIYVVQPQCQRLALNNTFVFAIRQHPSSLGVSVLGPSSNAGGVSPIPFVRPTSAMSMTSSSAAGSKYSDSTNGSGGSGSKKPAKLAIQTPGGKILRLMRKEERRGMTVPSRGGGPEEEAGDGGTWETIIKCSEKGVWRGLVLADRTARWCVFAEWVCEG